MHWWFRGVQQYYGLSRFSATLFRPDLVAQTLSGQAEAWPQRRILPPPTVDGTLAPDAEHPGQYEVAVQTRASRPLRTGQVFLDGALVTEQEISGVAAEFAAAVNVPAGKHWATIVVVDDEGHMSEPLSLGVNVASSPVPPPQVGGLAVGIDAFPNLPGEENLRYAGNDAVAVAALLQRQIGRASCRERV